MFKSGVKEETEANFQADEDRQRLLSFSRLNRILDQPHINRVSYVPDTGNYLERGPEFNERYKPKHKQLKVEIQNPNDEVEVGKYVAKVVIPQLKVDTRSIGGTV
eukprot:CAMPEP_0178936716 /NCGR_PEP_ID=MMETSP0786-20121207/25335_1 /TAXON_ID=186022 /ORGANISM="Thalassionema frauenfeldii, Strain CCMP 1798" /LENGTH=104 /DNA_ID=CAMNT_0020615165 /DNA_START=37 /DNA_END=347 /DNA_ORIENTATION=-